MTPTIEDLEKAQGYLDYLAKEEELCPIGPPYPHDKLCTPCMGTGLIAALEWTVIKCVHWFWSSGKWQHTKPDCPSYIPRKLHEISLDDILVDLWSQGFTQINFSNMPHAVVCQVIKQAEAISSSGVTALLAAIEAAYIIKSSPNEQ